MDYSPPGSSAHGILQARILEWVAIPFSRGSPQPRDQAWVSCIAGRFFTIWATDVALLPTNGQKQQLWRPSSFCMPIEGSRAELELIIQRSAVWVRTGSVLFSHSVVSNSWCPHGLQQARLPCPSPTPGACSNSCPLSQWCRPTISTSVIPFSSCLQSLPVSGSFPMSQFFTSVGRRIGVSASASDLPMYIQDWFPLGWTGWISWLSKGLSRVFSNTRVQKHQFFGAQLSLYSITHIHTWLLEKP